MVVFIRTGRLLKQGIDLYHDRNFFLAKDVFYQALKFDAANEHDFTINFWLARVYIMLNNYEMANIFLTTCEKLMPGLLKRIITPWDDFTNKIQSGILLTSEELLNYNSVIEKNLEQCYYKKYFSIFEIVIACVMIILAARLSLIISMFGIQAVMIQIVIMSLIILYYANSRTELPLNLWIRYKITINEIKKLMTSLSFLTFLGGYALLDIASLVIGTYYYGCTKDDIDSVFRTYMFMMPVFPFVSKRQKGRFFFIIEIA